MYRRLLKKARQKRSLWSNFFLRLGGLSVMRVRDVEIHSKALVRDLSQRKKISLRFLSLRLWPCMPASGTSQRHSVSGLQACWPPIGRLVKPKALPPQTDAGATRKTTAPSLRVSSPDHAPCPATSLHRKRFSGWGRGRLPHSSACGGNRKSISKIHFRSR